MSPTQELIILGPQDSWIPDRVNIYGGTGNYTAIACNPCGFTISGFLTQEEALTLARMHISPTTALQQSSRGLFRSRSRCTALGISLRKEA